MHREHRVSDIDRADSHPCRRDRTDGRTAGEVAPTDEMLGRDSRFVTKSLEDSRGHGIAGVGLVRIRLDDGPPAHHGAMAGFVLVGIVRMNRVGHVRAAARVVVKKLNAKLKHYIEV